MAADPPLHGRLFHGRDRWFESVFLQRRVHVSRDFVLPPRKGGLFPPVCGAEQGSAVERDGRGRLIRCRRAAVSLSGQIPVPQRGGLIMRIGQRPRRACSADRTRPVVDVRGSSKAEHRQLLVPSHWQTRVRQQLIAVPVRGGLMNADGAQAKPSAVR